MPSSFTAGIVVFFIILTVLYGLFLRWLHRPNWRLYSPAGLKGYSVSNREHCFMVAEGAAIGKFCHIVFLSDGPTACFDHHHPLMPTSRAFSVQEAQTGQRIAVVDILEGGELPLVELCGYSSSRDELPVFKAKPTDVIAD